MMHSLIAQAATQPSAWTAEGLTLVIGGLVTLIGALSAAVIAVIKASKASTLSDINSDRLDRQSTRQDRIESDQKTIALHTPAPSQRPATPNDPSTLRSQP